MKRFVVILSVIALGVAGFLLVRENFSENTESSPNSIEIEQEKSANPHPKPKNRTLKQFTGEEFKQLAFSVKYPNLQFFEEPPAITGNQAADGRIRAIARARGYELTGVPVSAIQKINEKYLTGDDLLQPLAVIGWEKLKKLAAKDNIPLAMTSAYRSPAFQRSLFLEMLAGNGASSVQIATGGGESAIISTLKRAALPGYSRHHTGYTIDLWCDDGSSQFLTSSCFSWISADNYQKAKQTGWIPSYPEDAGLQGPEPEPWEYIWVGEGNLVDSL